MWNLILRPSVGATNVTRTKMKWERLCSFSKVMTRRWYVFILYSFNKFSRFWGHLKSIAFHVRSIPYNVCKHYMTVKCLRNGIPSGLVLMNSVSVPKSRLTFKNSQAVIRIEERNELLLAQNDTNLLSIWRSCSRCMGRDGAWWSWWTTSTGPQVLGILKNYTCSRFACRRLELFGVTMYNQMKSAISTPMQESITGLPDVMLALWFSDVV